MEQVRCEGMVVGWLVETKLKGCAAALPSLLVLYRVGANLACSATLTWWALCLTMSVP